MKIEVNTKRFAEMMKLHNLNNYSLAPMVDVDRTYISKIRNGHRQPGRDVAYKIAKVFKIEYKELFTEVEDTIMAGRPKKSTK